MSKAIFSKWECNSCGNTIVNRQVLVENSNKTKYSFDSPKQCSCGNKSNFNLTHFEQMYSYIVTKEEKDKIKNILEIDNE